MPTSKEIPMELKPGDIDADLCVKVAIKLNWRIRLAIWLVTLAAKIGGFGFEIEEAEQ